VAATHPSAHADVRRPAARCIIDAVPDPIEPVVHRVTETDEEIDAFWRAREPIMKAQQLAAPAVAAALVGMTVAEARARVEQESEQRGVPFHVQFKEPDGWPQTGEYAYGRIRAFVRDGVVVAASGG
jgi:hypothetical protein